MSWQPPFQSKKTTQSFEVIYQTSMKVQHFFWLWFNKCLHETLAPWKYITRSVELKGLTEKNCIHEECVWRIERNHVFEPFKETFQGPKKHSGIVFDLKHSASNMTARHTKSTSWYEQIGLIQGKQLSLLQYVCDFFYFIFWWWRRLIGPQLKLRCAALATSWIKKIAVDANNCRIHESFHAISNYAETLNMLC